MDHGPESALRLDPALDDALIDAALDLVADAGPAGLSLDAVAHRAGCSRATAYRSFPGGREVLVSAALAREAAALRCTVEAAVAGAGDAEAAVVAGFVAAGRFLGRHRALRRLVTHHPDAVAAHVSFHRQQALLVAAGEAIGPALSRRDPSVPALLARRIVEHGARMLLSHLLDPRPGVDLGDPAALERLARQYLVPALRPTDHLPEPREQEHP